MSRKIIIGLIISIIIVSVSLVCYFIFNKEKANENNITSVNGKVLVVYYSATGSTKRVAEQLAKNLNADLFEIEPAEPYTSVDLDWTDNDSRVSKEHNDESLRTVKLKRTNVANWDSYDTVLIGYPIWWGISAWPVDSFVISNNFDDKTVIPFCTSASSELGQSADLLAAKATGGNWKEGHRFNSGVSNSNIKAWTDSLL